MIAGFVHVILIIVHLLKLKKLNLMATFQFKDSEVATMRDFYHEELRKTLSRLEHIKGVLDQLGDNTTQIQISVGGAQAISTAASKAKTTEAKAGATSESKAAPKASKGKKRGPKSIWGAFILKRLQQLDKPLTYEELVEEAMVYFKLKEERRQSVTNAIINSAFRLRKNSGRVDTFAKGGRIKFVALKSWFEAPGKIKAEYGKKVTSPKEKPRKPRRKKAVTKPTNPVVAKAAAPKSAAAKPATPKTSATRGPGRPKGPSAANKTSGVKTATRTKVTPVKTAPAAKKATASEDKK
ncbi:MAG: hypothetical protein EA392_02750 [Cryomorphaceae bacterium]|nr:MAG: hypothetical protein EA392_02750 [Cryomorphaceae bacterium]